MSRDQQICSSLEEKLHVYAALSALSGRTDASLGEPRLLVQPHSEDLPQAAVLLTAALHEGEILSIYSAGRYIDIHYSFICFLFADDPEQEVKKKIRNIKVGFLRFSCILSGIIIGNNLLILTIYTTYFTYIVTALTSHSGF